MNKRKTLAEQMYSRTMMDKDTYKQQERRHYEWYDCIPRIAGLKVKPKTKLTKKQIDKLYDDFGNVVFISDKLAAVILTDYEIQVWEYTWDGFQLIEILQRKK